MEVRSNDKKNKTPPPVFLSASPDRLQFLTEESVSLRCEGQPSSAGWTVRRTVRRTVGAKTQKCGGGPDDFGSSEGSSCIMLDVSSSSDSGVYWCENSDGQRSPELNVTVSGSSLHTHARTHAHTHTHTRTRTHTEPRTHTLVVH